jgi:uncharacterized protein YoxC
MVFFVSGLFVALSVVIHIFLFTMQRKHSKDIERLFKRTDEVREVINSNATQTEEIINAIVEDVRYLKSFEKSAREIAILLLKDLGSSIDKKEDKDEPSTKEHVQAGAE